MEEWRRVCVGAARFTGSYWSDAIGNLPVLWFQSVVLAPVNNAQIRICRICRIWSLVAVEWRERKGEVVRGGDPGAISGRTGATVALSLASCRQLFLAAGSNLASANDGHTLINKSPIRCVGTIGNERR